MFHDIRSNVCTNNINNIWFCGPKIFSFCTRYIGIVLTSKPWPRAETYHIFRNCIFTKYVRLSLMTASYFLCSHIPYYGCMLFAGNEPHLIYISIYLYLSLSIYILEDDNDIAMSRLQLLMCTQWVVSVTLYDMSVRILLVSPYVNLTIAIFISFYRPVYSRKWGCKSVVYFGIDILVWRHNHQIIGLDSTVRVFRFVFLSISLICRVSSFYFHIWFSMGIVLTFAKIIWHDNHLELTG